MKITKKHHKHINNPFPSTPKSLSLIEGNLSFNPHTLPSHHVYSIGTHFQLVWSSINGGHLSISHISQPRRSIWATIPGQAFVSAAMTETEVEESRGSFAIKDTKVHLVCNHQTIEEIRVINDDFDWSLDDKDQGFPSGHLGLDLQQVLHDAKSKTPVLVMTGWIFNMKRKRKKGQKSYAVQERRLLDFSTPSASTKYWVLFYQKNTHQIGFQVKLGQQNFDPKSRGSHQRLGQIRRRWLGPWWFPLRPKGFVADASVDKDEREEVNQVVKPLEFNRICMTYASEGNERFYGFGEQFSHMDFKGKRVPIFVQEQGIGRGDQPITLAINLVSYR